MAVLIKDDTETGRKRSNITPQQCGTVDSDSFCRTATTNHIIVSIVTTKMCNG